MIKNRKLLIIGASILQVPAIKKAKEMGLTVGVADFNPSAVGIQFADEYFNCSTLNKDGINKVVKEFSADGVMTMATDMPMRTISYVCKQNGLIGLTEQCALNCTDKIEMIKRFKSANVPSPNFSEVKSIEELESAVDKVGFPCILKPADNSGSRGVVLCRNKSDCILNYAYTVASSHNGKILVEEYMTGSEVSIEVFVENGITHILQITDKITTGAPHFVELGHSQPTRLENKICENIRVISQKACESVGLTDGPAHLEMIIDDGCPKMVEMGARMGGDCITSHLVPLSTGIDMTEQTIRYSLGLSLDLEPKYQKASAVVFLTTKQGKIKKIENVSEAYKVVGVTDIGFFKKVGDECTEINSSSDRVGFVVAQSTTAEKALEACNIAASKIRIDVV